MKDVSSREKKNTCAYTRQVQGQQKVFPVVKCPRNGNSDILATINKYLEHSGQLVALVYSFPVITRPVSKDRVIGSSSPGHAASATMSPSQCCEYFAESPPDESSNSHSLHTVRGVTSHFRLLSP